MAFESLAESEDPRDIELISLSAIYPEIESDPTDAHAFFLELPVRPAKPVTVFFPAPAAGVVDAALAQDPVQPRDNVNGQRHADVTLEDSHELSYMPSIRLHVSLPDGYPAERPPRVELNTMPSWVPAHRIKELVAQCEHLWEELGKDSVVFTYIDYIQQSAEDAFGVADDKEGLMVDLQHKIAILDYDISAKRAAFERETFDCGVCLDPKKGSACHRMSDCGHVFCTACLQDFYNNAIREGDISSVRCLAPNCAKERENAAAVAGTGTGLKKRKKPKLVSPSELLQIPLEHDVVKRYVTLKYKSELESDKNTVYCPRPWCNGAARSKRHRKPDGFEFSEGSDESEDEGEDVDQETGQAPAKAKPYNKTEDLLAICEDCGFAFCSRCYLSWHGEFFRCTPRRDKEELTTEEKASLEYLQLHTTPCPTCAAPAQKTHGCNHMICGRQGCGTHFCYLCSAWLDPGNPYSHYNQQPGGRVTGCYGRLWELEAGDGDDVGLEFAGGPGGRRGDRPAAGDIGEGDELIPVLIPEIEEVEDFDEPEGHDMAEGRQGGNEGQQPANNNENVMQGGVALEAPLVLRIAAEPPAPPAVPMPPPVGGPRAANRQPNQNPGARPQNQRGRAGGRGGREGQNLARRGRGNQVPNHRHDQNQARDNGVPARGRGGRARRGGAAVGQRAPEQDGDGDMVEAQLNEAQRAWVRQFVQMALNDQEDLVESDSDDDEEEMVFWIP